MTFSRLALLLSIALAVAASAQQGTPPAGERGRGRGGGDPFAGQPRINALIVSGGCSHDYPGQAKGPSDPLPIAPNGKGIPTGAEW